MSTLKFNPLAPTIILNAEIQATHPTVATLALDAGASWVVLPWRLVSAIGIVIDPRKTIKTTTATAVETVPRVIIPQMSVLGKSAKNVEAIVKDLPPEAPVDGLLGLSFLKHFKMTVDFQKGVLSLE